ncbi:hypothetical protein [Komagataeibacter medellinensis]|uniref:Uncharacterized protein n=1 Tax=Komagataeibacter medellinensis (strain NBRC 3288 / BCRC 11682 / LMG 1693 / Kondo 51) TaxID=634177 RepID=G2I5J2_KOMMN|nr:hypothetical protein [Komagataeibacter medellinensis]BAK83389.1 hypothetical protein GLX_09770 [Komagataeibacter medellinensis NBRC 3288]
MLVLLLGMLVICSLSGSGGRGGGLVWHGGLTAGCVCLSGWKAGQIGPDCLLAVLMAGGVGLLGVQMLHVPASGRERGGLRLSGGLACVVVLTQVMMQGTEDMTQHFMVMAALCAVLCGVWGACIARGPAALCAGLACGLDGVMLLGAQAGSMLVMAEAIVAVAGLNAVLARIPRMGGDLS